MDLMFWRKKKRRGGARPGGKLDLDALGISESDPEWEAKLRTILAERGHRNPDKVVARARKRFARKAGTPAA